MEIVPGLHKVDGVKGANAYLILATEPILVDTGLPGQEKVLLRYLSQLGYRTGDLKYILLTHYDLDHVGSVAAVQKETGARICAHEAEIAFIAGRQPRLGVKKYLPKVTAAFYGRLQSVEVDVALRDGDVLGNARIMHTPGHTPGHVCAGIGSAWIIGDLLMGGVKEAPGFFIWNRQLARESVQKLAALSPEALLPGHGEPDLAPGERLSSLLAKWQRA